MKAQMEGYSIEGTPAEIREFLGGRREVARQATLSAAPPRKVPVARAPRAARRNSWYTAAEDAVILNALTGPRKITTTGRFRKGVTERLARTLRRTRSSVANRVRALRAKNGLARQHRTRRGQ